MLIGLFFFKVNRVGQEVAILAHQVLQAGFFGKLHFIFHEIQLDRGAPSGAIPTAEFKVWATITGPLNGLSVFLIRETLDLYFFGHHKGGVKTQTKMPNDLAFAFFFALIALYKLVSTRKGHFVNVFFDLIGGHADARIANA